MEELNEAEARELASTLDKSLWDGEIPYDWLDSHVAAIPKPDKDPTKIASYRILTMQNTVGKLLEKIVALRVAAALEKKRCFRQHWAATEGAKTLG